MTIVDESFETHKTKFNKQVKKLLVSDPSQRVPIKVHLNGNFATIYNSIKKGDILYIDNIQVKDYFGVKRLESKKDHTIIFGLQKGKTKMKFVKDDPPATRVLNQRSHTRSFSQLLYKNMTNNSLNKEKLLQVAKESKVNILKREQINNKDFHECRIIDVTQIITYIGCTIHKYKLQKGGYCKKCKGYAIHSSKFYLSTYFVKHLKSNKTIECIAFCSTFDIIKIPVEDYDPSMFKSIYTRLKADGNFCMKLLKSPTKEDEYITPV